MAHLSPQLARTVRHRHGVVTASQLRRDGLDPHTVDRLRCRGVLTRVYPGLYRVAGVGGDFHAGCTIVCLAHVTGAIGGAAAAALWGLEHIYRPLHPEFVHHDPDRERRVRGINYRTSPDARSIRTVERADGIRVFDRSETWLDCVAELTTPHAERFTRHVLSRHCSADELFGAVERWESRRRRRPPGRSRRLLDELTGTAEVHSAA